MLNSQKLRDLAPEIDSLRLGSGWKLDDLAKPQVIIESTFGDSHPGSVHLFDLVEAVKNPFIKMEDLEHVTLLQTFAMVRHKGMMV